jgi:DDE superfamily endonuclease
MIPGWPYSVIAALEPGRTSWTAVLDAVRLGPGDDQTEVTAAQVREVVARLVAAGHWRQGDLPVMVLFDAGYDVTRLAWLLADLVELVGRLRSDRVMWLPAPPRRPGTNGRPRKHGRELPLSGPAACPPAGRRPAPPLGTARPARAAHPGPRPPRVQEHPREGLPPGRCAETRQTRPGQATRVEEPPPGTPLGRGQDDEEGAHAQGQTRTPRLNGKLAC